MSMNMNLSFLIKNPKIAADVSGLYIFAIVFIPLLMANNKGSWTPLFYFIPQIVFTGDLNYSQTNGTTHFGFVIIQAFLAIGYFFLFLYLDKVLPNETGLHKSPCFCLKKKKKIMTDRPEIKDEELNVGEIKKNEVIKVKNLVKQFGEFKAVNDISFSIKSNKVTCILGHNGAGKSTMINMLCGILKSTSGKIIFKGKDISTHPEAIDGQIGYCAAFDVLYDSFTVYEYLTFVADMKSIETPHDHIMHLIKTFALDQCKDKKIVSLSGGERRRVTVLMAVLGEPPIVFLDEPSSGIDPQNRRFMWEIIEDLRAEDRAVILTTHHLEEAEVLSEE
jgi:ATP-binding cassette subfamily A (ABC1) protein 3